MHERKQLQNEGSAARILLSAAVALPLVFMATGCPPADRTADEPAEMVLGERVEERTMQVVRDAGLPESFAFAGRAWVPRTVHWEEHREHVTEPRRDDPAQVQQPTDDPAAQQPGQPGQPGQQPGQPGQPDRDHRAIGDFEPVSEFEVEGHQIWRRTGIDLTMTDRIYLQAEGVTQPGVDQPGQQPGATQPGQQPDATEPGMTDEPGATEPGMTDEPGTAQPGQQPDARDQVPGQQPGMTQDHQHVAFVEYEPVHDTLQGMDEQQIAAEANLPQTVTFQNRQFTLRNHQEYDAGTFAEMQQAPQPVEGQEAYMPAEENVLVVRSNVPGEVTIGQDTIERGPVFMRYEAEDAGLFGGDGTDGQQTW